MKPSRNIVNMEVNHSAKHDTLGNRSQQALTFFIRFFYRAIFRLEQVKKETGRMFFQWAKMKNLSFSYSLAMSLAI